METLERELKNLQRAMQRTWKRLPLSQLLHEPLPISVSVVDVEDDDPCSPQHSRGSFEALSNGLINGESRPVIVRAGPGGGKTTALRWAANCFARQAIENEEAPIPVYVDLSGLTGWQGGDFESLVKTELRSRDPVNYSVFTDCGRSFVYLLDGIDLIPKQSARKALVKAAFSAGERVVVSTRPNEQLNEWLADRSHVTWIDLDALDQASRDTWLEENTSVEAQERFQNLAHRNPHLRSLLDVPLIFAMTASICVDPPKSGFDITAYPGRAGIFDGFVEFAIQRGLEDGRIECEDVETFRLQSHRLDQLCLSARDEGYRDWVPDDLLKALERTRVTDSWWLSVRKVLVQSGILYRDEGKKGYGFLHQQFAEFFASRGLALSFSEAAEQHRFESVALDWLQLIENDDVTSQSLAILYSDEKTRGLVDRAFEATSVASVGSACELLAKSGPEFAATYIVSALEDPGAIIQRVEIVEQAALVPSMAILDALKKIVHLEEELMDLRRIAIITIGQSDFPPATSYLNDFANDQTLSYSLRVCAMAQGGDVKSEKEAISVLLSMLDFDQYEPSFDLTDSLEAFDRGDYTDKVLLEKVVHVREAITRWLNDPKKQLQEDYDVHEVDDELMDESEPRPDQPFSEAYVDVLIDKLEDDYPEGFTANVILTQLSDKISQWEVVDERCRVKGASLEHRSDFANEVGRRVLCPDFERKAHDQLGIKEDETGDGITLSHIMEVLTEMRSFLKDPPKKKRTNLTPTRKKHLWAVMEKAIADDPDGIRSKHLAKLTGMDDSWVRRQQPWLLRNEASAVSEGGAQDQAARSISEVIGNYCDALLRLEASDSRSHEDIGAALEEYREHVAEIRGHEDAKSGLEEFALEIKGHLSDPELPAPARALLKRIYNETRNVIIALI